MADYALVGITSLAERKKLFGLLQSLNSARKKTGLVNSPVLKENTSNGASSDKSNAARPETQQLLYSPTGVEQQRLSIDRFDAEKDRALALMAEIDQQYITIKPASPVTVGQPLITSPSTATSRTGKSSVTVASTNATNGVRTNSRAAARASANKRPTSSVVQTSFATISSTSGAKASAIAADPPSTPSVKPTARSHARTLNSTQTTHKRDSGNNTVSLRCFVRVDDCARWQQLFDPSASVASPRSSVSPTTVVRPASNVRCTTHQLFFVSPGSECAGSVTRSRRQARLRVACCRCRARHREGG
jgi:hypothetical protein